MSRTCKQCLALLMALFMVVGAVNMPAMAAGEDTNQGEPAAVSTASGLGVEHRSQDEVQAYVNAHPALLTQEIEYQTEPSLAEPYAPGVLSEKTINSALNMLNQVRYIAGVGEVTHNEEYAQLASKGTLLNFLNDTLSHYPDRPSVLSDSKYDDLYNQGYDAAGSSNIAYSRGMVPSLNSDIITGWCADEDESNIDRVGHRRWFLSPALAEVGFGATLQGTLKYSATYIKHNIFSIPQDVYVAWPAQEMPIQYFENNYPWSLSLGYSNIGDVSVKLERKADGQAWNFASGSSDGELYISKEGYGSPGAIIFRPKDISIQAGDTYTVTVNIGSSTTIQYTVNFFELVSPVNVSGVELDVPSLEMKKGETHQLKADVTPSDATNKNVTYKSSNEQVAQVSQDGLVTAVGAGTADITVTTEDGGYTDTCSVTVLHEHVYGSEWKSDESGHWHVCEEDGSKDKVVEHAFEWKVDKAATEQEEGLKHEECSVCGFVRSKDTAIPKLDHTHVMTLNEKVEAGCVTEGKQEYYTCSKCGKYFSDKNGSLEITDLNSLVIPATGHSWTEWHVTQKAGCTTTGTEERNCSKCGETQKQDIAAFGHKWDAAIEWSNDYSSASVKRTCANDPTHTETLAASVKVKETAATCTQAGELVYTATAAFSDGTVITDTKNVQGKPALGHAFTKYVWNGDNTETAECDHGCGQTDTRESEVKFEVKDDTDDSLNVDTKGLNLKKYENDIKNENVNVTVKQETAVPEKVETLKKELENGYETVASFEISMLMQIGQKQQELTDNFGSIQLSLPAGREYSGKQAVVYQLHGEEIIKHNGTVDSSGNVSITVDKLSTFMVAVSEDAPTAPTVTPTEPTVTPADKPTTTPADEPTAAPADKDTDDDSPKTADVNYLFMWIALCAAGLTGLALLCRKTGKQQ